MCENISDNFNIEHGPTKVKVTTWHEFLILKILIMYTNFNLWGQNDTMIFKVNGQGQTATWILEPKGVCESCITY